MNNKDIKELTKNLQEESKAREEMLDDALKDIAVYSENFVKQEENLQQFKLEEIKYKTTIKELNGYIEIYNSKVETMSQENQKQESELSKLRKKVLKQETKLSSLQSILDLFIHQYGIKQISEITKLEEDQLTKLVEHS
mgnify:FL=1